MENLEQPKISAEKIQKAANEAAEAAYLSAIKDYYTSYNSPYKKMINAELEKQEFSYPMNLPDIMAKVNQSITDEIDKIANEAIAMSFMPLVSNALLRMDKHIKLYDVLQSILEETDGEHENIEDYNFSYKKHRNYDWLDCALSTPDSMYEFTLHTVTDEKRLKEGEVLTYKMLSFPASKAKTGYNSNMILHKDDIKIEMPFTANILSDKVLAYFMKMMLSACEITMNCDNFSEDMLPERECYCD